MTPTDLRPHQIFYLEQDNSRLYGELIQWVAERNLCWLRPIALCCLPETADHTANQSSFAALSFAASAASAASTDSGAAILYDLSQGADLICPDSLLRLALDIEVLPVLAQLHSLKPELAPPQNAHRLRQFIQQLWQAEPAAFQRSSDWP
jgi:hypothetical protein